MTATDASHDAAARKQRAAAASVAASALLTIGKLVAGLLSGSLALLSEALHSLIDTGATILTWFAVRAADRPADAEHHYGHGKVEAVAALAETGLLIVLACGVLYEAIQRLSGHAAAPVEVSWIVFAVLGASIVVDAVRWRSLAKIARETKSDALAADAMHFSSDLVASVCVSLGLIAVSYGFQRGDSYAAIGVAVFIFIAGYRLGRRTIDTLMDKAPDGLTEQVREIVGHVPGVANVEDIRLRQSGAALIGEVAVAVARTLPVERIMSIKDEITARITAALPEAALVVIANSRALDDETVLERVLVTAARKRLMVHHVTLQTVDGIRSIGFDLEVDGRMTLGAAHDVASQLEAAIRDELGPEIEVDSHIEPLEARELHGENAPAARTASIAATLQEAAQASKIISDVHDVRARQTPAGLIISYHCRAMAEASVEDVHQAVDLLDRRVKTQFADVARIVGHAEPYGA
ncbi:MULTISPECIES: cation diffusion facilitator family transporter [unclassified Beijerinckia]|uniref:cation diffusion facilitator family transporter n=1 Tax=unclassified Beijerinckia TaxID=2638183 RepID=UPI000896D93B|nr:MULTISPECIES: cation diffusion facilitator family transporter [unclassified Beijerinckia]MDH7796330.1 cation diffusion facilitator family transporter [Beijerinckia sp. GAS462]SEC40409.1 cation diffusion facilitator family transporter [Beijerinckia sp. 28-YEA-48]